MTDLHQRLGPVVLDLAGTELQPGEAEILRHPQVGGIILFSRNYTCPQQLQELVEAIRCVRPGLLVTVDQEGGRVQRFRGEFSRLPPLQKIGAQFRVDSERGVTLAQACGWLMAAELRALDVDLSFAPVLDADDVVSDVIGDRSFGRDFLDVSTLGSAFIRGMNEAGMAATAKHFPGHGAIKADSHVESPIDLRQFEQVEDEDMVPFRRLSDQFQAVMPAHIQFPNIDPLPVGFSPFWLQRILREQLGFSGVIFSDDLSMHGAASLGDYRQRAEQALRAGCDSILVCNHPQRAIEVLDHLDALQWPQTGRLAELKGTDQNRINGLRALRTLPRWQECQDLIQKIAL